MLTSAKLMKNDNLYKMSNLRLSMAVTQISRHKILHNVDFYENKGAIISKIKEKYYSIFNGNRTPIANQIEIFTQPQNLEPSIYGDKFP